VISRLERRDRRPDLVDDADALMAENAAGLASRDVAFEDVQICSADCRFGHFYDSIRRCR
jgi:hypothetical protein